MTRSRSGAAWLAALGAAALVLAAPRLGLAASCTVTSGDLDANGTPDLKITGSSGLQTLVLDDDAAGIIVSLDCNHDGDFLDTALGDVNATAYPGVETMVVQMGGLDTITYNQQAPFSGVVRNLQITLGPNANFVTVTGNDTISANSSLVVDLFGGPNLDTVTVDFAAATLNNSALVVYAELGTGSDVFTVHEPQATNSKVDVEASLGLGDNRVLVDSAGSVSNSDLRFYLEGGDNTLYTHDYVNTSFASSLTNSSRVQIFASLRDGEDLFNAAFPTGFAALTGSEARLRASGHTGNDFLSVSDGVQVGAATVNGLLEAVLRGGPGNDALDVNWNGLTGSGTLRTREHGGVFVDKVFLSVLTGSSSSNNLDLLVQGGRANDTVFSAVFDPGGSASYSPAGSTILDGGLENDICILFGDGTNESVNCEPGS